MDERVVTVHAAWSPSGSLFLWGVRAGGGIADATELKQQLFAWHAPSFYGTFLNTDEQQYKEGVLVPVDTALDYFGEDRPALAHAKFAWSPEAATLKRLTPAISEALDHGRFMPDYAKWTRGERGWKLELPDAMRGEVGPVAAAWCDALVAERVREQPELREALARLERAHPLLAEAAAGGQWLDEDDWLEAIGWAHDARPFRTALQLVEPDDGGAWQLAVALQDRVHPEQLAACDAAGVPLEPDRLPEAWQAALPRAQADVQRWLHIAPGLRAAGEPPRVREELSHDEAWDFLAHASGRLAAAGSTVLLPAWWERVRRLRPRLRASIRSAAAGGAEGEGLGLGALMRFDWRLAVGDLELTEAEFRELAAQKRRLVQFRGRWIQLDPAQLAQIERAVKRLNRKQGLSLAEVLEMHLMGGAPLEDEVGGVPIEDALWMEVELNDHLQSLMDQLERHEGIPRIETPETFHGTLRPYQLEGAAWLLFLRRFGLGGCLADDMGLGKTIQWITYLLAVKADAAAHDAVSGPSLLVCPTSVLGNWQKELERFAPSLRVHLHYGPQRFSGKRFAETATGTDVVLTSYTLAHLDEDTLGTVTWSAICLDEAQNIKNAYTKQAAAVRRLDGLHRIALTGTPIENRLSELWSIFDFINPGYLGTQREFTQRFAAPIEKGTDPEAVGLVQRLIRPFLLRRVKKDPAIQLDLPDKTESKAYVSLTPEQASLYENYLDDVFTRIERLSAMERRGHILAALTKLKQLCNHPALFLKEPASLADRERSNKTDRLLDMVAELRQEGDRCLIFTQFVETGHLIERLLRHELGDDVRFLHGGTPKAERDRLIETFQSQHDAAGGDGGFGVFLLSLKAGGTGLNLTAANHVFHFDRWWNPAVENQATDRAFRIGQTRHVQVHKFVTLGTLEERIDDMIERKQGLSRQIVGAGENWITELSTDELRELFSLRREWSGV